MNHGIENMRKRFSRISLIWFTRILRQLSKFVPYRVGVRAGGILGFAAYHLLSRTRKRAIAHLSSIFGEKGDAWIHHTARRTFIHLGKSLLEVMLITPRRLSRIVEFRGFENLRNATEQGRGVIYVTGHLGNWELMGAAVAARLPLSVVAAPIEPDPVNDMIVGLRAGMGVRTILRSRPGASRELIRIFKENRVLGILIDQDTEVESAFVDFMGRPAWTPTAAAQMAFKFNAPVVFGYIRRENNDKHAITVKGPLNLIRTGDEAKDIVANTALFTKMIEDCIVQQPEQWVWMHRRWRRQP